MRCDPEQEGVDRSNHLRRREKVHQDRHPYWFHINKPVIVDLDDNGLDDVMKYYYPGSQGLALGCYLYVYSQIEEGKFVRHKLPAERFSNDDVFDLDGDGKKEFVTCALVKFRGHNYWVYRCWQLKGKAIINVDKDHRFPRAVWFTHKPNRRLVGAKTLKQIMKNYPKLELSGERTTMNEGLKTTREQTQP